MTTRRIISSLVIGRKATTPTWCGSGQPLPSRRGSWKGAPPRGSSRRNFTASPSACARRTRPRTALRTPTPRMTTCWTCVTAGSLRRGWGGMGSLGTKPRRSSRRTPATATSTTDRGTRRSARSRPGSGRRSSGRLPRPPGRATSWSSAGLSSWREMAVWTTPATTGTRSAPSLRSWTRSSESTTVSSMKRRSYPIMHPPRRPRPIACSRSA
mmetsp:Transcript_53751/g.142966  ORF Transcript_53751/g.142966 Transcript_53751/m.142966 type:complete len:212 (+) Transcript_53751:1200-1835(+)